MTKNVHDVTRTVYLDEDEASRLSDLAARQGVSETSLLQQPVLRGMRELQIEQAVGAYRRDELDLRESAALAGVPIGVFIEHLSEHGVPMLRDPSIIERELADLRMTFGRGPDQNGPTEQRSG
jgi:hypothetical protein